MNLKKGMIVKWMGNNPCIGKLQKKKDRWDCWVLNDTEPDDNGACHDSCHESNLIPATKEEKKQYRKSGQLILRS